MVFLRRTDLFLIIVAAVCLKNEIITGNICEDTAALHNASTIKMCEDGNVTSRNVVLDTHEAESTGETTCKCEVTDEAATHVLAVGAEVNPNTTECGSKITVLDDHGNLTFECMKFPSVPLGVESFSIIWEKMVPGDSKYCLNITSISDPLMNVTVVCEKPLKSTTEIATSLQPTRYNTTTYTSTPAIIDPHTNATTIASNTTDATTNVNDSYHTSKSNTMTSYTSTGDTGTTTSDIQTTTVTKTFSLPLRIVIPAAGGGGGLLLIIIIIVTIACCCRRKRKQSDVEREEDNDKDYTDPEEQDDTPIKRDDMNKHCENDHEKDGVKDNILYHSFINRNGKQVHTTSPHVTVDGNYSSVPDFKTETAGAMYAQVQKKKVPETVQKDNNEEMEMTVRTGSNDVYAVVNKSLKNKPNTESYTTEEGLVYLKVDHTKPTEKESTPSGNNKDTETVGKGIDTVNYTEVNL